MLEPNNVDRLISSQAIDDYNTINYISCGFEDGYIMLLNSRNANVLVKCITLQYTKTTD